MRSILVFTLCSGLLLPVALEAGTTVLYEPAWPNIGPFPTDIRTQVDATQKTGLRVDLDGAPVCEGSPFVSCNAVNQLLNQLDGFSVKPQIRICFSGPIDITTVKGGVAMAPADESGPATPVNQIFYDPFSYDTEHSRLVWCVMAKPDSVLNQSTQYLLYVTNKVRDANGKPVVQDEAFKSCLKNRASAYCAAVKQALKRGPEQEVNVVAASLFTTMSATDWMQKARQLLQASPFVPTLLPAGPKNVFNVADLQSFQWLPQTNINAPPSTSVPIPLQALAGVERVAFGLYLSPNFLQTSGPTAGSIAVTPTGGPIQNPVPVNDPALNGLPPGYIPLSYHVFLPPAVDPRAKIPVVIFGHGTRDSQFGGPTAIASTLARAGFATLSMNFAFHGYGPGSLSLLTDSTGPHAVSTPGRSISLQPDGSVQPFDGCILPGPIVIRDCLRQSAVDVMALVQAVSATGLGLNLDPSRIYYVGQSLGSYVGSLVHAVEPDVRAAVFNVGGDSIVDTGRLSFGDPLSDFYLLTYNPTLAGVVGDIPAQDPTFDYFFPYRDRLTTAPFAGLGDIQRVFEVADWLNIPGAPLAFAPHFQIQPLPGVPRKEMLFQFGFGDLEVTNPTESALVRAAVGPDLDPSAPLPVQYWRFDLAVATDPHLAQIFQPGFPLPILPHRILANPTLLDPANADELLVTLAVQQRVASFFRTGAIDVTPPLFEIPTLSSLPNDRNFGWLFEFAPGP